VYCSSIVFRRIWRYQREVIRIRKSKKDRERNDKKKTNKKTNNKQQSIKHTHKTKDRVTRTPLKTWGERRCSGRVSSSCYTSGTRRANLVANPVISHEWGKDREVFTPNGTYPLLFVTHIFHNGQPSHVYACTYMSIFEGGLALL